MIKKISHINNCTNCFKLGNYLLYQSDEFVFINNERFEKCSIYDFSEYNDILYYSAEQRLYKIKNLKKYEVIFLKGANSIKAIANNNFLYYERISRKELKYVFFNGDFNELWNETGDSRLDILSESYIKFRRRLELNITSFTIRKVDTGKIVFSYSLPNNNKIYGDIHIYKNILVVPQEDEQDKITMVGLDITSGKTLWQTKTSLAYYKKKDNKLYGFASTVFGDNFYSEINIKTGELFEKSFTGYKKNVVSHLAAIHNNYLYYSVYKNSCEIGIIDLQSKDIIHEYPLNLEQSVQIGTPVVTDDKIYILDSNNTLHIYEKEENL